MGAMKAVFLAPSYPPEMQQYTRGLAEVGQEVQGSLADGVEDRLGGAHHLPARAGGAELVDEVDDVEAGAEAAEVGAVDQVCFVPRSLIVVGWLEDGPVVTHRAFLRRRAFVRICLQWSGFAHRTRSRSALWSLGRPRL